MNNNNKISQRQKHILFYTQLQKAQKITNAQPIWLKRTFQYKLQPRSVFKSAFFKPVQIISSIAGVAIVVDCIIGHRYIQLW